MKKRDRRRIPYFHWQPVNRRRTKEKRCCSLCCCCCLSFSLLLLSVVFHFSQISRERSWKSGEERIRRNGETSFFSHFSPHIWDETFSKRCWRWCLGDLIFHSTCASLNRPLAFRTLTQTHTPIFSFFLLRSFVLVDEARQSCRSNGETPAIFEERSPVGCSRRRKEGGREGGK